MMDVRAERALRKAYAKQLDAVGDILVRHGVVSRASIRRDGVQFAVRNRFEPRQGHHKRKP